MRYLVAEANYARELAANTRELLALSKEWGQARSHEEREKFFAEMKNGGRINLGPKPGEDPKTLYSVDADGVARINIVGQLTPVAEQDICGGYTANALTEFGYIAAASAAADADPRVNKVQYFINSPGGYVAGLQIARQAMVDVSKPTEALVGDLAASGGYWLATVTDWIAAETVASRFGSIGVIAEDLNPDRMLAAKGIDHHVMTSTEAPNKHADTNTPEGRAKIVAGLDRIHATFRDQVAADRGVSVDHVRENFGKGDVLSATEALAVGMIDEIRASSVSRREKVQIEQGGVAASAERPIKSKGKSMKTLEELKAENPDLYAQAVAVGREQGIKAERDRREELSHWTGADMSEAVQAVAQEAISQGKTYAEVASQLSAAAARGPGAKAKLNDNPPKVASAAPAALEADPEAVEGMSAADVKALMAGDPKKGIKGMSIEEIRAVARKEA